jgi:hypothetical protein
MKTFFSILFLFSLYLTAEVAKQAPAKLQTDQIKTEPSQTKTLQPNKPTTTTLSDISEDETYIKHVESDKQILTKNDPEQTGETPSDKSKDKCNKELLGFYNLEGLDTPVMKVHKYCPNVTRSCCNVGDESRTAEMWMSEQESVTEKYYENFLNSMKYLLGFSQEVMQLSFDFSDVPDEIQEKSLDKLKKHLLKNRARMLVDDESVRIFKPKLIFRKQEMLNLEEECNSIKTISLN